MTPPRSLIAPSKRHMLRLTTYIQPLRSITLGPKRVASLASAPRLSYHRERTTYASTMPARRHDMYVRSSNRLILCFDGTGNAFQGTPGDTNIIKLYNMFDRTNVSQMHYYQRNICSRRSLEAC